MLVKEMVKMLVMMRILTGFPIVAIGSIDHRGVYCMEKDSCCMDMFQHSSCYISKAESDTKGCIALLSKLAHLNMGIQQIQWKSLKIQELMRVHLLELMLAL